MPWRWRRSLRVGPFRWNLSRSGVGVSWGIPGLRYGINAYGRRYISIGLPGTGLYFYKYLDGPTPPDTSSGSGPQQSAPTQGSAPPLSTYMSSSVPPPAQQSQPPAQPGSDPWWRQEDLD